MTRPAVLRLSAGLLLALACLGCVPETPEPAALRDAAPAGCPGAPAGSRDAGREDLLFDADVGRNGLTAYAEVIHGERITVVPDPVLGARRQVMRFTVEDDDIGPTRDPRAQVETPAVLEGGDEVWIGWSTLFPEDWPSRLPPGGSAWLTLSELYGPPFDGAAPVKIGMRSGAPAVTWQRNGSYDWDVAWEQGPVLRERWYDFVLRVRLSDDPAIGFVELYLDTGDGWQQQSLRGRDRLHMRTLDDANGGGANYHKLALYRQRGLFPVLTVYHAEHRVGGSFAAVAPRSHAGEGAAAPPDVPAGACRA